MKTAPTVSVLAHLGYDSAQIQRMLASVESDGNVIHAGADDAAVIAAAARGLCKLSPMQAQRAAQGNEGLLAVFNRVRAQSARYGIELGDSTLDVHDIDRKLKAANLTIDQKMNYKASLHFLKLI